MYEQQQEVQPTTGLLGQMRRQQVMIPGLEHLAASQTQVQTQVQITATNATIAAMEVVPTESPTPDLATLPHGSQGRYKTPAQKKKKTKQTAAAMVKSIATPPKSASTDLKQPRESRDVRTQPSAASGGVPNPTPSYFTVSFQSPAELPASRRILIIMDLNGTILHRPSKKRPFHFVERPHARRFMQYCLDNFCVAIWSSARPHNVLNMVSQLLTPAQVDQCLVTWARDKFGLTSEDYDSRVQCYKRLTTVWNDPAIQAAHPQAAEGGRWNQSNTVLVDDSVEKGRSEPHNILVLPEFAGASFEKADVLPQVHDYLNTLSLQANISSYMRETPFQLDASYALGKRT